jgi:D-amino-acid dehydrogenase
MSKLIVVGAGVVGLSCALAAQKRGWQVTVIDKDFEGDRTSHGNAGGLAVSECIPLSLSGLGLKPVKWLLDPLGPLAIRASHAPHLLPWFLALRKVSEPENHQRISNALAALNSRCMGDFEAMLNDISLSHALHKVGALAVYESHAAFQKDTAEWMLKRTLGFQWRQVDKAEVMALEPGLAPVFETGVMLEDWAHIDDPAQLVTALRQRVQALGATLVRGSVTAVAAHDTNGPAAVLADGTSHSAHKLLIAAGAWSAQLAKTVGDRALLESERGYNTTLPHCAHLLKRQVVFAERKFVATPLSVGLRIGGAAEFAGLHAAPNYQRSDALLALARRFIGHLDERDTKKWMGHRPSTPDSLPVISASKAAHNVLYAFGHGHLGLTQSASTAALIGQLLDGEPTSIDMAPFSISRF